MSADVTKAPAAGSASKHRRASSSVAGLLSAKDFEEQNPEGVPGLVKGADKVNWKMNDKEKIKEVDLDLTKFLTNPPLKKVDLVFPQTNLTITARNLKGVTIKDALDAVHKHYKGRPDDELAEPYLAGFYTDAEDDKGKAIVRVGVGKEGAAIGKKKK